MVVKSNLLSKITSVYASNLINGILGILLVRYIVGTSGFAQYGVYSIYLAIQGWFLVFDSSVSREVIRDMVIANSFEGVSEKVVNMMAAIFAFMIILFLVCAALIGFGFASVYLFVFAICIVEFSLNLFVTVRQSIFLSMQEFHIVSRFGLFSGLVRYAFLFVGLYFRVDLKIILASLLLKKIIDILISVKMYKFDLNLWGYLKANGVNLKSGLNYIRGTLDTTTAQIGQTLLISAPAFLGLHFLGNRNFGIFRAIFDLVSKVWFISNGIGLVAFPILSKMRSTFNSDNARLLFIINRISFSLYILIFCLIGLFNNQLSRFIHLNDQEYGHIILFISAGMLLNAHSNFQYELLQGFKLSKAIFLSSVWSIIPYLFLLLRGDDIRVLSLCWLASQVIYVITLEYEIKRGIPNTFSSQKLIETVVLISIFLLLTFGTTYVFYFVLISSLISIFVSFNGLRRKSQEVSL